ncbi:iron-sulfur cluster assembly scaffold protein [Marinobacter sp. LV10MA510-1]|uniref:iron-sulfur cluster assembly scaffold protein n=1 Tax=Marinobacter sp. LV10MA510-1 TaxID=1415567 RepID=UPI000BF5117B|nr:iron-sulfur cluster assembly scaffold protein [Marinobacter sp. LV10MA510-1]PFG09072.1 NifU-like protein involved in Fe-S cluster formation [Marinobacter sp. LV10MA510-1]
MSDEGSALSAEEFVLSLKRYITQVRRDRRLSGLNVRTTTVHSRQLCGSRLTLDAIIEENRIKELGYQVRACSLGQATTAIVYERAPGMTAEELQSVQSQLEQILKNDVPPQNTLIWTELAIFQHAAFMPSRHDSALLPFRALQEIFSKERHGES